MSHTLEIKEYNKYLIIKIANVTPKLKHVGTGTLLSGFNSKDVLISESALNILYANIGKTFDKEPVLEILSPLSLWFSSFKGIIIPPDEILHVYELPYYSLTDNNIDESLKKIIDNYQKD